MKTRIAAMVAALAAACGSGEAESPLVQTQSDLSTFLSNRGGPIVSGARVVVVNWGGGVDAQVASTMPAMYSSVLGSAYFDWLSEYGVGHGSFASAITILPLNGGAIISDTDVDNELIAQINA